MDDLKTILSNYSLKDIEIKKKDWGSKKTDLVESLIRNSQQDKVESVKENITDIEEMIRLREDLSIETLKSIDKIIDSIDKVLMEIQGYVSGNHNIQQADLKKEMLKKKFEMTQAKVDEKLNLWKDISALKKELREHLKELRDMESKNAMLENLMDL